jgi:hypothetical protein
MEEHEVEEEENGRAVDGHLGEKMTENYHNCDNGVTKLPKWLRGTHDYHFWGRIVTHSTDFSI